MNKLINSIILLTISIASLSAQNNVDAERVITNLLNSVKTSAIKTNFRLNISEKNAVNSHSTSGTFLMKNNKFVLELDDMKVWFDGKTQWAYMSQTNEVSITEPTESELAETNPMAILSGYKSKCNIQFGKNASNQNQIVVMTPKQKNSDVTKIEVQVNKTSNNLYSIQLQYKNGTRSNLVLSNYQKSVNASDDIFIFNKSKYKGVTINDLR
jgi:outer membrane lipoprotein-sorting protein